MNFMVLHLRALIYYISTLTTRGGFSLLDRLVEIYNCIYAYIFGLCSLSLMQVVKMKLWLSIFSYLTYDISYFLFVKWFLLRQFSETTKKSLNLRYVFTILKMFFIREKGIVEKYSFFICIILAFMYIKIWNTIGHLQKSMEERFSAQLSKIAHFLAFQNPLIYRSKSFVIFLRKSNLFL